VPLQAPAKKTVPFSLSVPNPLRPPQCYRVEWDAAAIPPHVTLRGPRSLEVPGRGSRECKFTFSSLLEGRLSVPITFTSELAGEAYSYTLEAQTAPAEVLGRGMPSSWTLVASRRASGARSGCC